MLEIDGSRESGSGTVVRDAISLSVLTGKDLRIINIRAKREKPGLRPQHLKAIEAAAQICCGGVKGAAVGSRKIEFRPQEIIKGGEFSWDIGTAGSATMLALTVVPLALFANGPSDYRITGGLFQDFAPSAYHLKYVLLPILKQMGIELNLVIIQPGYVPQGKGQIRLKAIPLRDNLRSLRLINQGNINEINGIALSSLLKARKVSYRMAKECKKALEVNGYESEIGVLDDTKEDPAYQSASVQAGAALAIWAKTDTGCLIGSDMAGKLRRTAEFIGKQTALHLIEDLRTTAAVDRHLADQIIPFAALAEGSSSVVIPRMTDHVQSRLWLVEEILGAKTESKGNLIRIEGIGYGRKKWR